MIDHAGIHNHTSALNANARAKHLLWVSQFGQRLSKNACLRNVNTNLRWDKERVELDLALPNQPHRDSLRGWQGPYLAGFQCIAAIDKQT